MHVTGHSWVIAASSSAGGANARRQPKAIARSLKYATLMRHATSHPPKRPAAASIPCAHSAPPVQSAIEPNVPGTSEHPPTAALDGGGPPADVALPLETLATLPLDVFAVASAASRRKCAFAIPSAANGTSSPRTMRLRVLMCT
eukprot:7037126-Prymnesium_polylepis.1